MTRSVEEVFRDHVDSVNSGDMQAILADYADDAQVLTAQGPLKGKAGVESFFTQAFSLLPGAQIAVKQTLLASTVCSCGGARIHLPGASKMASTPL